MANSETTAARSAPPFETNESHLRAELERLDALLHARWEAIQDRSPDSPSRDVRALVIADGEVKDLLDGAQDEIPESEWARRGEEAHAEIQRKLALCWEAGSPPNLEILCVLFHLTSFERDVVLLLLAPELHLKYERIYGYLQDDATCAYLTVGLVLRLLCGSFEEQIAARSAFCSEATLLRCGLIEFRGPAEGMPLLARGLKLEDRIVDFLLYRSMDAPELRGIAQMVPPRDEEVLPQAAVELVSELAERFRTAVFASKKGTTDPLPARCSLVGAPGSGRMEIALAVSARIGLRLLVVDGAKLAERPEGLADVARKIAREAVLGGSAIYIDTVEALAPEPNLDARRSPIESLLLELSGHLGPVFLGWARMPPSHRDAISAIPCWTVPLPRRSEQRRILERELEAVGVSLSRDEVAEVISQLRITPGRMRTAVRSVAGFSRGSAPRVSEIRDALRAAAAPRLPGLAELITPRVAWEDLVLPADRLVQLREMCDEVRLRELVLDDWVFGGRTARGRGTHALFAGPPGTGKTLAAEVIATVLGLPLYRIDLAGVVSKYIGETEKNLRTLFDAARDSCAVLFFDEADALFGKRTQVKDSHDRYANIEINYLLQKLEGYDGLSILATNQLGHLDEAFTRRLRFLIDFPLPDEVQRRGIWEVALRAKAVLGDDLDLEFLSNRFKIAGGSIRNAALSAAYFAASEGSELGMAHVVRGVQRELQKLGRICTQSDFGRYFPLIQGAV